MSFNATEMAFAQTSRSNSKAKNDSLSLNDILDIINADENIVAMLTDKDSIFPELLSQIDVAISSYFGRVAMHNERNTRVSIRTQTVASQKRPNTPFDENIATIITTPHGTKHSCEVAQTNISPYAPKSIARNQKILSQKEIDPWLRYKNPYKEIHVTLTRRSYYYNKARKALRPLFGGFSAQQLAPDIDHAEFLHIQSHSSGGKETLNNIVIGSWAFNSLMIIYEQIAKELLRNKICASLQLNAKVTLKPHSLTGYTHIAEKIDMQIVTDKGFTIDFPTISDQELSKRKDKNYFRELYNTVVTRIQRPVPDIKPHCKRQNDREPPSASDLSKAKKRLSFGEENQKSSNNEKILSESSQFQANTINFFSQEALPLRKLDNNNSEYLLSILSLIV